MKFILYDDVKAFYRDTIDVLMRHEAQNLIALGNIMIGKSGLDKTDWRDPAYWLMAVVSDDSGVRLTAIMTPPHNIALYATDNIIDDAALKCLVNGINQTSYIIDGVISEKALAVKFAEAYCNVGDLGYKVSQNQRIYELTQVNPEILSIGELRSARDADMSFLPFWIEGFAHDCFNDQSNPMSNEGRYRYEIQYAKRYILEYMGTAVSMARAHREMMTVCGIGGVYTPPYFRGKGYATSCVAALSRLVLARGFKKCVLYTDLANPVSNSIYQKIGYVPICDSVMISFIRY